MRPCFRFAPSPNCELHLGHALSALVGYRMALRTGGRFLVRIEDIDKVRCRPELSEAALDDLRWLGLCWEEPVLRQSDHFSVYRSAARLLYGMGLLYPCFATRSEIEDAAAKSPGLVDPDGSPIYPGLHRGLDPSEVARRIAAGQPFALRLDMERALDALSRILKGAPLTFTETSEDGATSETIEAHPERWGDVVIVRKDTPTSYHLAVTVDDARQGVTHVTRGQDLFHATHVHRLIQVLLGLPEPIYHHHRLITDVTGRKLSKSAGDTSLRSLRNAGATREDVLVLLGLEAAEPDS